MYKKSILIVISFLTISFGGIAQQQNPQLVFDRANQQLEEGNTQQALTLYHQLETDNKLSGALFMNLGVGYVRLDSMGKAKYYFLKARRFEETEQQAIDALDYVENRFSHQSAVLPELPWQKALNWLGSEVGSATLLGIGLLLFNLGIIGFIGYWFISKSSKIWSRSALATIVTGGLIILISFYVNYRHQRYSKAVMITQQANVLEQPQPQATIINQSFEGYTFTVDHQKSNGQNNWSYIRMSNGLYGWIPTKEIMIL